MLFLDEGACVGGDGPKPHEALLPQMGGGERDRRLGGAVGSRATRPEPGEGGIGSSKCRGEGGGGGQGAETEAEAGVEVAAQSACAARL